VPFYIWFIYLRELFAYVASLINQANSTEDDTERSGNVETAANIYTNFERDIFLKEAEKYNMLLMNYKTQNQKL